jgi:MFS family permease
MIETVTSKEKDSSGKADVRETNGQSRRWLRYIAVEGGAATVFVILTGGAFLTGMALMLGANDFQIGLLVAIPFLMQLAQLASPLLVEKFGGRKNLVLRAALVARQIWWLIIPVLFLSGGWRLEALLALVMISGIITMLAAPAWLSWMSELVPERIRGRFFGVRNSGVAIATVGGSIIGGIIVDAYKSRGMENAGFAAIIGLGCLAAIIAFLYTYKLPSNLTEQDRQKFTLSRLTAPLKEKRYRYLLTAFVAWNFATGISAAFFAPHMLNNLDMNFTLISLYSSAAALTAILLNKPWGALVDKFGCRPVIIICSFMIAIVPLIWLIPKRGFIWILFPEVIFSGAFWSGFNLAAFNMPIAYSPKEERIGYLAVFSVLTGLGFFLASLIGGILAHAWGGIQLRYGSYAFINYHFLFVISGLLRFLGALMLSALKEPGSRGVPVMAQFMGYSVLRWLAIGRQILPDLIAFSKRKSKSG